MQVITMTNFVCKLYLFGAEVYVLLLFYGACLKSTNRNIKKHTET